MNQETLLKKLEEAIYTEETAVPIYAKHLEAILEFAELSNEQQAQIKAYFEILLKDTKKHQKLFKYIRNQIKKEG
jgi:hypothetical protein